MASLNRVILLGRLVRDPVLRYLPSQAAVVEFGLAVNRRFTANGEKREEVCFVDCVLFGKGGEVVNQYVHKGDPLLVEGRLKFDTWEKDGQKRTKHSVVVENFQLMGGKPQRADDEVPQF